MYSDELISALLFEAEGAELDFKRDQYPFEGADDRSKSELLKDIIAFANAWRRTDAYILIGIQEVKEAESTVIGIAAHIDDAKIQQFVNTKTNRPVDFSYTPTSFRGKQIGVIHIPVQERPVFLTKDYGPLRRNTVYLRRGSSTDEARPDEIARMGREVSGHKTLRPILTPLLATGADWSNVADTVSFEAVYLNCPEIRKLPDYFSPEPEGPFGIKFHSTLRHTNSDFYRNRAEYLYFKAKFRPIRFGVRNDGTALASGVKVVIQVMDFKHSVEFMLGEDQPKEPVREWSPLDQIGSFSTNDPVPDIDIFKTNSGWTIVAHLGKIQAKDTMLTSEKIFAGMNYSDKVELLVSIFADEFSNPTTTSLSLQFSVTEKILTHEQLVN